MQLRSYIIRDELYGSNALRFAEQLGAVSLDHVDGIELSLGRNSRVDVAGLAVLVRVYSHLEATGRELVVRDAPAHVRSQFARIGLSSLLADEPRSSLFAAPFARFARLGRATA